MTPSHERQAKFRKRRAEKLARVTKMEAALTAILEKLDGNEKPLAVAVRRIAEEALRGGLNNGHQ